jgi:hypothetical protein
VARATVGAIRKAIRGLPDNALVMPDWTANSVPDDDQPGVELLGVEQSEYAGKPYLSVTVLRLRACPRLVGRPGIPNHTVAGP